MAVAIAEQLYMSAQSVPRPIEVVKMAATLTRRSFVTSVV